jgi:hypothetical protein
MVAKIARSEDFYMVRQSAVQTLLVFIIVMGVVGLFACALMYDLNSNQAAEDWGYARGPAALIPIVLAVFVLVLFVWPRLRVQMMFRRYPALGRPRSASFDSYGMHMKSEDSQGDYKWSLFHRIVETRKVFMFAVPPRGAPTFRNTAFQVQVKLRVCAS